MRLFLACMIGLFAFPALAQQNCAPRETVTERLASLYGETRQAIGIVGDGGNVMEVFASDERGTWTITVTLPNGLTCLIGDGDAFERLAETLPPQGEDM